ncbi:MAG: GNAT family N-acetyltransferase [Thermoanaerobaculia bacterium]
MSAFTVRPATPRDAAGIRRLHARVFGSEMTEAEWAWKFEWNPDGRFGIVAVAGDRIVGNYAGWGARFLLAGEPALLYAVGDVATEPEARGLTGLRGVYRAMVDAFYAALESRVPFCFGFPNDRALVISHRLAGSRTLFPIRHVLVDCDAFPAAPAGTGSGDFVDESFDSLWESASRLLTHAAVRDRGRVNWRFHARPNRYYRMVWWREGSRLRGWAALSVSQEEALVADFLGSEAEGRDLPALFAASAAEARRMGARRLVFWETPGGPGRETIARLPGERRDAGFSIVARVLDETRFQGFAEGLHLVPSLYDVI